MPLDQELHDEGLVLQAAIEVSGCQVPLPSRARGFRQLIVLGHGGRTFFDRTFSDASFANNSDPLDERSISLFKSFTARAGCTEFDILYPTQHDSLDLRKLGTQLGWQSDSQLGIGIHPVWGTWFAYRLVAVANTALPVSQPEPAADPCGACIEKPCLAACPVAATGDEFQLNACSGERLREGAICADRCLAREVCPVGIDHKYSRAQVRYHYRHSYLALREA